MSIPTKQKAAVAEIGLKPKVNIVHDYPIPQIKDDELLVRLICSGICHSDISSLTGEWGFYPSCQVGGHEGIGRIVKHGKSVNQKEVPFGLTVGIPLIYNECGSCSACIRGGGQFCRTTPYYGIRVDGTWKEYCVINKNNIIPIPQNLTSFDDLVKATPILCAGVTVYKALKAANKQKGDWIVITAGGGGLGTLAIQYAKEMGLKIIVIDTGKEKKELTLSLGSDAFFDFKEDDVVKGIMDLTANDGADASIMIAPNEYSYNQAFDYLAPKGSLICIGIPEDSARISVSPSKLIASGLTITGSMVGSKLDQREALDYVSRGKINPVTHIVKLEDLQNVIDEMTEGKIKGRFVIDLR